MTTELLVEVKKTNIRIEEEAPEFHVLLVRPYHQYQLPQYLNLTKRPSESMQNACKYCLGQSPGEAKTPRIYLIIQTFNPR